MSSLTVRISDKGHKILKDLAAQANKTVTETLDEILECERRRRFFEEMDNAYAALQTDETSWKQAQEERALLDSTLLDGLDPHEGVE